MPAAAVIPAPVAYIKVVAVKKLVVGFLRTCKSNFCETGEFSLSVNKVWHSLVGFELRYFTLRKLECFRQAWPEYISME